MHIQDFQDISRLQIVALPHFMIIENNDAEKKVGSRFWMLWDVAFLLARPCEFPMLYLYFIDQAKKPLNSSAE